MYEPWMDVRLGQMLKQDKGTSKPDLGQFIHFPDWICKLMNNEVLLLP